MNKRKFLRLFMVLFIPLLILGIVVGNIIFNRSGEQFARILCTPDYSGEHCRSVGELDGKWHRQLKSEYPAWFDVLKRDYDESSYLHNFIMASTRVLPDVQIIAVHYDGFDADAKSFMNYSVGRRAIVKLGIDKEEKSFISEDTPIIYCYSLTFEAKEGEYTSYCFGDGWGAGFTYRAIGASRDNLEKLLASINQIEDSRRREYNIYRVVMYPIFIYLFILISFISWIFVKAVRFVKNG